MWDRRVEPVGPAFALLILPGAKSCYVVPPVPPAGTTKINKTACSTTGSTGHPEARRFSRKNENVTVANVESIS